MTSPTRPYSSHSCPNSNSAEIISVCSLERGGCRPPSRLSFGHQFWTTQCRLFGIVANVWAKPIDSSAKVVVWATDNLGGCHPRFEGLEHFRKGRMQELAPKLAEWRVVSVSIIAIHIVSIEINACYSEDLLLGMARKPRSMTPFRCARRILLCMLPIEIYTGQ